MLGRIPYDDFVPYRASGRSTLQVLSIKPPTIYVTHTLAEVRHCVYLIEKHTELVIPRDVVVVCLPEVEKAIKDLPNWFIEVDHWLRPQLPGRIWEQITERNAEIMEATSARNDGHSSTEHPV